jgi:hypothetical protein
MRSPSAPRRALAAPALACFALAAAATPARARDLADIIPGLYGGDGAITLRQTSGVPHDASFFSPELGRLSQINDALSQLPSTLPVGSSAASFAYTLNPETGIPERTAADGLGPLFVERARTVGRFKLDTAFLYTHIQFGEFQGEDLEGRRFAARLRDIPGGEFNFENDTVEVDVDIEARQEIFSFFLTFGVTEWLDVNAVVPLVYVKLDVDANATLVTTDRVHTFDGAPDQPRSGDSGDAFGFGDVLLRAKWRFLDTFFGAKPPLSDKVELAVLAQVKLPTGDDDDLLGTGNTNFRVLGIASKTLEGWFEPHLNIGYEWSGTRASLDSLLYAGGFAVKAMDELTVFLDVIGRHERKEDGVGDDIIDLSIGAKVNPWRNLILSGNVLLPLNEQGLRADWIPSFAVEYIW